MRATLRRLFCATGLALGLAPSLASAQVVDWTQGWTGQATLYAWLPVINGSQEGPQGQPIVDLDTSDVLSALDMAFMGNAQFRKDKFGIILDAVYARLSTDGTWIEQRVKTQTKTTLGTYTAALSWRVYDDPKAFVDIYGGARFFDTDVEFKIGTANLGQATFSKSLTWTDPIVGLNAGYFINDQWSLHGFADVGGFDGSKDTSWEVYGGANYAFNDHWDGTLGYRYMSIQKTVTSRASLDISIQGPVLGITYKF